MLATWIGFLMVSAMAARTLIWATLEQDRLK